MTHQESIVSLKEDQNIPISKRFRGYLPVVIDVETGGFNPRSDALLEIAAIILAFDNKGFIQPSEVFFEAVIPFQGANIEQAALDFTGIDPYHPFRTAKPESVVIKGLFHIVRQALNSYNCKRAILVGHNAAFDRRVLEQATYRCKVKRDPFHPFSTFDTVSLAALVYGQTVLAKACEKADINFSSKEAHSALYDAAKTAELFCKVVNQWKEYEDGSKNEQDATR